MFKYTTSLVFTTLLTLSSVAFAQDVKEPDPIKVNVLLRPKMITDFASKQNSMDFDLSGIRVERVINDNISGIIYPGFARSSANVNSSSINNDMLTFVLIEGYFNFKDVTKNYGDAGLGMKVGQFTVPFYNVEQSYQPFRFIYKPLDYKMMPTNFADLGVMLHRPIADNMVDIWLGYVTGAGIWNSELRSDDLNDNVNAGCLLLTTSFFPFKKGSDAIKDLSLTFNLKAVARTSARSSYNFLLGYKYSSLATSVEYLNTYSTNRSKDLTATSFGISYDVYGPFQAIGRWDYSDNNSAAVHLDHLFLIGVNTKWQKGAIQASLTYDQDYDPAAKKAIAKRLMLATQFYY